MKYALIGVDRSHLELTIHFKEELLKIKFEILAKWSRKWNWRKAQAVNSAHYAEVMPSQRRIKCDFITQSFWAYYGNHSLISFQFKSAIDLESLNKMYDVTQKLELFT